MISVEFRSVGPGKCRWCKKDKDVVISLSFSDNSFVGSYCFADFKKALLDKLEGSLPPLAARPNGAPLVAAPAE
jgi:hypothetical protein